MVVACALAERMYSIDYSACSYTDMYMSVPYTGVYMSVQCLPAFLVQCLHDAVAACIVHTCMHSVTI
jgi:hypothetical protein